MVRYEIKGKKEKTEKIRYFKLKYSHSGGIILSSVNEIDEDCWDIVEIKQNGYLKRHNYIGTSAGLQLNDKQQIELECD